MQSFLDREDGASRGGLFVIRLPRQLYVTYRLPYVCILFMDGDETSEGFGFRCRR